MDHAYEGAKGKRGVFRIVAVLRPYTDCLGDAPGLDEIASNLRMGYAKAFLLHHIQRFLFGAALVDQSRVALFQRGRHREHPDIVQQAGGKELADRQPGLRTHDRRSAGDDLREQSCCNTVPPIARVVEVASGFLETVDDADRDHDAPHFIEAHASDRVPGRYDAIRARVEQHAICDLEHPGRHRRILGDDGRDIQCPIAIDVEVGESEVNDLGERGKIAGP